MRTRVLSILGMTALVATLAGVAVREGRSAAPVTPSQAALDLSHDIMSPYCPGLTLAACPSSSAFDLRAEIRTRFERGESRDAITRDLLARFGDEVQGTPARSGLGLVVWFLPVVVAAGLAGAMRVVLRRGGDRMSPERSPAETVGRTRLRQQLEDELEALE